MHAERHTIMTTMATFFYVAMWHKICTTDTFTVKFQDELDEEMVMFLVISR